MSNAMPWGGAGEPKDSILWKRNTQLLFVLTLAALMKMWFAKQAPMLNSTLPKKRMSPGCPQTSALRRRLASLWLA